MYFLVRSFEVDRYFEGEGGREGLCGVVNARECVDIGVRGGTLAERAARMRATI